MAAMSPVWNGASAAMTRALDANTSDELEQAVTTVEEGTSAGASFRQTSVNFTLDTGAVAFVSFGQSAPAASTTTPGVAAFATQSEVDTGTLASADSERVRKANRAAQNKRLAQMRGSRTGLTVEVLDTESLNSLVAGTVAWSGIVLGGETLELTDVNARRVYTELPWLRRQVDEFMGEQGNFGKTSPQS